MPPTIVTTILLVLLVTLCQAECPIECFCDQVTICSGDKQLTRLPLFTAAEQRTVSRLELHDFLLTHLDKATFLRLISNLTELRLTNNPQLASMDNNTFSFTTHPHRDDDDDDDDHHHPPASSPESAPDSRRNNNNDNNSDDDQENDYQDSKKRRKKVIGSSSSSSSTSLSSIVFNLRTLDLSGNGLEYFVAGGRLKRLRVLDLSSNRLQQVYRLHTLTSLESVNLRDNQLTLLDRSTFQTLVKLQYINLDSNRIVRLDPTTFSNLPSLAHLILSSNPIENLLAGFFWNSRVQFVDVSRVGLDRIPASLTTSVRDFRCANNNLTTIRQSDFESYPNVGLLVLDENSIHTVEDDAFGRLDFLSRLWINGNRLSRIPQNLPLSLRSLQLEDNRIGSLNASDFKNLINLEELNLNGNRLGSVPPFIFCELMNLRSLDLRSNQLDTLEKSSFANLIKLETLDVSGNPIKVIVDGVFKDLIKLSTLQLSRLEESSMEFDTSSFYPLVNLRILELDDSPYLAQRILRDSASSVTASSGNSGLSFFMSLVELNLERCNLEDLRIVSTALTESSLLDTLTALKLSGNPWRCTSPPQDLREFIQLYKKQIILDINQMICAQPKGIKVLSIALKAAENITAITTTTTTTSNRNNNKDSTAAPNQPSLPPEAKAKAVTPPITPTTPLLHSQFTSTTPTITTARRKQPTNLMTSQSPLTTNSTSTPSTAADAATAASHFTTRPSAAAGVQHSLKSPPTVPTDPLQITEKPTRSYFDDQNPSEAEETTTATEPISNKAEDQEEEEGARQIKLFPQSSSSSSSAAAAAWATGDEIQDRDEANLSEHERGKSKTNDDNAIIDEHRSPASSQHVSQEMSQKNKKKKNKSTSKKKETEAESQPQLASPDRHNHHERQTPPASAAATLAARSIDGFPAAFHPRPHPVTMESPSNPSTTTSTAKDHPSSSYLREIKSGKLASTFEHIHLAGMEAAEDTDGGGEGGGKTVIFKTLAILAIACLVSILFLLLLSITFSRISWPFKSNSSIPISIARRKWDKRKGEEEQVGVCDYHTHHSYSASSSSSCSNNTSYYQNLNPSSAPATHRGPTGRSYTRLPDQDTVELSGITNRLYFENEDIYHIT